MANAYVSFMGTYNMIKVASYGITIKVLTYVLYLGIFGNTILTVI